MAPRGWGFWTEAKLDILSAYLRAFGVAGSKRAPGALVYLDLYAGNASNVRRDTGQDIQGSAVRALEALPDYAHLYLFELAGVASRLDRKLRASHPHRSFEIVPGDANVELPSVLSRISADGLQWAPTFAFVDPYSTASLRWSTIERLADFKRNRKNKVEQWLLFFGSDIPRVRGADRDHAEASLQETFGGDLWRPIAEARDAADLTADQARREYTNLLRWRLEHTLGYRFTHTMEMKNTSGSYLYDLVFATDNDAGNKIMADVYGRAAARSELMRAEAYEHRRAYRTGQASLFGAEEVGAMTAKDVPPYAAEPPTLPYGFHRGDDI